MKTTSKLAFAVLEEFSPGAIGDARAQREIEERVAQALDQGYQRGLAAGRAEALADFEQRLSDLAIRSEADLNAERQSWQYGTGTHLADAMENGVQRLSDTIEHRVAALLKPWLMEKIYDQAINAFHAAVERAAIDGATIEISGSEILVSGVEQRLSGKARILTSITSGDESVVVKVDDAVISANFSVWMSELEGSRHE